MIKPQWPEIQEGGDYAPWVMARTVFCYLQWLKNKKHYSKQTKISVQFSHPYMTTGKTIALTRRTFVGKVMSLLLNMLSMFVITFLPRSKRLNFMAAVTICSDFAAAAKLLQSCPTLCDPTDGSPPGSAIPGILQARTLEWVAISFSNAWKWKVKVKSLSHVRLFMTPWTAAYEAPPSMGFSRQEYWSGLPLPEPPKIKSVTVSTVSPSTCHEVMGQDAMIFVL